jgi:hypothetical protein
MTVALAKAYEQRHCPPTTSPHQRLLGLQGPCAPMILILLRSMQLRDLPRHHN